MFHYCSDLSDRSDLSDVLWYMEDVITPVIIVHLESIVVCTKSKVNVLCNTFSQYLKALFSEIKFIGKCILENVPDLLGAVKS